MKSKLDEMLDCISYVFPKGLRIKSVYSTDETVKSTGIKFPPYGNMVFYGFYFNIKKIFQRKREKFIFFFFYFCFKKYKKRNKKIKKI